MTNYMIYCDRSRRTWLDMKLCADGHLKDPCAGCGRTPERLESCKENEKQLRGKGSGALPYAVDTFIEYTSDIGDEPYIHFFNCPFCGDTFGVVELPRTYKGAEPQISVFPISRIDPSYRCRQPEAHGRLIPGLTHSVKLIDSEGRAGLLGWVERLDRHYGKKKKRDEIKEQLLEFLPDKRSAQMIKSGWKNNSWLDEMEGETLDFIKIHGNIASGEEILNYLLEKDGWGRSWHGTDKRESDLIYMLEDMSDKKFIEFGKKGLAYKLHIQFFRLATKVKLKDQNV